MEDEDITYITKSDGKKYTIRKDRHEYFFPDEWLSFINAIKRDKHKMFFETLLYTGARAMEALHIRAGDFDFKRNQVILKVTKKRASKKKSYSLERKRVFFVPKKYIKKVTKYINKYNLNEEDYLFLNNNELPENYKTLINKEKKKYYQKKKDSYYQLFKRKLEEADIGKRYKLSLHNIRKTYGMWMRIFHDIEEICQRMGHDKETFMTYYGTSLRFDPTDKKKIMSIMGDVR